MKASFKVQNQRFEKSLLYFSDNFIKIIKPYRDGRLITRVFLGVNDGKSNWKIYG